MPTFEHIEDKKPHELIIGDHIIYQDRFWRVVGNYTVLGYPEYTRRMLMIVPELHLNPRGFKFLEITSESRIAAYNRTE